MAPATIPTITTKIIKRAKIFVTNQKLFTHFLIAFTILVMFIPTYQLLALLIPHRVYTKPVPVKYRIHMHSQYQSFLLHRIL